MRALIAAAVIGVLIGFGGGYIVNDQVGGHDRTLTVQHKRDPAPKSLFDQGGSRCDFAGFCS